MGYFSELDYELREGAEMPDFLNDSGDLKTSDPETKINCVESDSGICVNLEDRALAIAGIMSIYNQMSKSHGAHSQLGSQSLVNHYGNEKANDILKIMDQKNKIAAKSLDYYFNVLVAAKSLKTAGFNSDYIELERDLLRANMSHEYGPGKVAVYNREELIKKVQPPHLKHFSKKSV